MKGRIHSFESMGALDGPGIRFVVFMQGCPMRCKYCHNPDTWKFGGGQEVHSEEIIEKALRFSTYFAKSGGVTLSGGEPLLQSKFCREIFKGLKEKKIHTALDTSGCYIDTDVKEALKYTDLVILDIKHANPEKFQELTGRKMDNTLLFLKYVDHMKIPLWIRQVIVPGINDTYEDMIALGAIIKPLSLVERVELLPYHTMGIKKWFDLGLEYSLCNVEEPSWDKMESLKGILREQGMKVY